MILRKRRVANPGDNQTRYTGSDKKPRPFVGSTSSTPAAPVPPGLRHGTGSSARSSSFSEDFFLPAKLPNVLRFEPFLAISARDSYRILGPMLFTIAMESSTNSSQRACSLIRLRFFAEDITTFARSRIDSEEVVRHYRHHDVELEIAFLPPLMAASLPKTCAQTIIIDSHITGLTCGRSSCGWSPALESRPIRNAGRCLTNERRSSS